MPWAYTCSKDYLSSEGLIIGGNFAFQNGLDLTMKTARTNSPWAYNREGLSSEGYLHLRFRGLIFGRAYFGGGLLSEFYGISFTQVRIFLTSFLVGSEGFIKKNCFLIRQPGIVQHIINI